MRFTSEVTLQSRELLRREIRLNSTLGVGDSQYVKRKVSSASIIASTFPSETRGTSFSRLLMLERLSTNNQTTITSRQLAGCSQMKSFTRVEG
jgi:hypothetical protein